MVETEVTVVFRRHDKNLNQCMVRLLNGPHHPQNAFVHGQTSFADLYAKASYLHNVFQRDVNVSCVCLCTQDRTTMGAALLASLAGGPVLILPHAFSLAVLSELQQLTGYRHVVTDRSRPIPDSAVCIIPQKGSMCRPFTEGSTPRKLDSEWVRLFTGGSTGTPKMWTKTVRNLLAETDSIVTHYEVMEKDCLVATVSPNHIYGMLYSILTPLLASAAVAAQTPSFPGEIEKVMNNVDASILVSVPAHYRALNGHSVRAPRLRLAFSSAGMLAAEDAEAFSTQTGIGIAEIYGSTETGGIAARVRADGETDFKPYDGIDIRLEDERLKVKSDYLSPGLKRDVDDYFMVGDRAVPTHGGRFLLLGRDDGVVKVGGRRVDLGVVKEHIKKQPGVRDAVVISLPVGQSRENQIVAMVEGDVYTADLNLSLLACLEPYACPRRIKVVSKIPITETGKYDRINIKKLFNDNYRVYKH